MTTQESKIKSLEKRIEHLYEILDGWKNLVENKDKIIKNYEEMVNKLRNLK